MRPGDWIDQLEVLNGMIESQQLVDTEEGNGRRKMTRITESEFWKFFGLMLAARLEGRVGTLWDSASAEPPGILRRVDYTSHMTRTRFQEIRKYMEFVFADKTLKGKDDWWQVLGGVNGLNENRKKIV